MKLSLVIDQLVQEKDLDKAALSQIICEGMIAAYQKKYPHLRLRADYDKVTDDLVVLVEKQVVASVDDEDTQISARKASFLDKKLEIGDMVWLPFSGSIGRIEILRAKQIIATKIRELEAAVVYKEFKDKEGTIVHGMIHKCERDGVVVKLGENLAYLPNAFKMPTDTCVAGYPIRALLKTVFPEPKNENQLILDRSSEGFLMALFDLEIPEVFEKIVEIKKIARIAGYKSKIAVISHDANVDPVGTCVGMGGARIKPILKELGGEKIDVIEWSENIEDLVRASLKPAEVKRVELVSGEALVFVDDDQRSLAIGKMGQNIQLASKLVGIGISLVQREPGKQDAPFSVD